MCYALLVVFPNITCCVCQHSVKALLTYLLTCIAKFGNLGANGVKGSKFLVENVIFGIADPDLLIHYATFMGLR